MAASKKPSGTVKKQSTARASSKSAAKKTGAAASAPRMTAAEKKKQIERQEMRQKAHNQMNAVILFLLAILLACFIFVPGKSVWNFLHNAILGLFGFCSIGWSLLLIYVAILISAEKSVPSISAKIWQIGIFIVLLSSTIYIFRSEDIAVPYLETLKQLFYDGAYRKGVGLLSGVLGIPMVTYLGSTGARIVILLLLVGFTMLLTGTGLLQFFRLFTHPATSVAQTVEKRYEERISQKQESPEAFPSPSRQKRNQPIDIPLDDALPQHPVRAENSKNEKLERLQKAFAVEDKKSEEDLKPEIPPALAEAEDISTIIQQSDDHQLEFILPDMPEEKEEEAPDLPLSETSAEPPAACPQEECKEDNSMEFKISMKETPAPVYHIIPPIELLEPSIPTDAIASEQERNSVGELLVETLKSFGVQTKILNISQGPAVTRYELQPSAGVKISKITSLADDIALNLAASGVRIEAPIPNKAAVGIEVPNKTVSVVKMRELIDSPAFQSAKSRLTVALGRDIGGEITLTDLAKMPHLLIAGSTGSGKSVCINSMIISLLYKSTPDEVRFLMIDPKVVELGVYNGIPHLLVPVVTDPRRAAGALNWAVSEMLNRYKLFADNNVRDLTSYNAAVAEWNKAAASAEENPQNPDGIKQNPLPQIVIIIDELADLMMAAPNEVEDSICRLAQMARAAGMHLVIATQRPSVDVITGIIKANIPSRIAFAVSSQVDSRTILDTGGAEKLLGRGDMLFAPSGSPKPVRVQGCFVSDKEIERIITHIKHSKTAEYDANIAEEIERQAIQEKENGNEDSEEDSAEDPAMADAIKCVVESGQASISLLQRKLSLGYARAGRLIDQMEQKGIVGPHMGSKPRQILITYQQYLEMMANNPPKNS